MDIFQALEQFNGNEFPLCLKTFLRHAAYDTKTSCRLLDEKTLGDIEQYIFETGKDIINDLKCCNSTQYMNQARFKFLPGHKSSILAIPSQIREMESAMESVNKKRRKTMTEFKKLLTPTELKKLLLKRLNQSAANIGFEEEPFTMNHLKTLQTMIIDNEMNAKCTVQCSQCSVDANIIFKGYWITSNFLRHLKTHWSVHGAHHSAPAIKTYCR